MPPLNNRRKPVNRKRKLDTIKQQISNLTPYQTHKKKWINCEECHLCAGRTQTVLFKGKIPCDVLIIGEAPGVSEDVLGKPFKGPAGNFLQQMLDKSGLAKFRLGFTNLVACLPEKNDQGKIGEPDKEAIKACTDRLQEMIEICNPQIIITAGTLSKKHLQKMQPCLKDSIKFYEIIHPAAILHQLDPSQKSLARHRTLCTFEEVIDEIVPF